jgi:hypothetical protein
MEKVKYKFTEEHRRKISEAVMKRTGERNAFYGKKHTLEARQRMSEAKKGKNKQLVEKEYIRCTECGILKHRDLFQDKKRKKAHLDGSVYEWISKYAKCKSCIAKIYGIPKKMERMTPEYFSWREAVLNRDRFTCRECNKKGRQLEVHHIWMESKVPFLKYEVWNGITLCQKCHRKIKGKEDLFLIAVSPHEKVKGVNGK